MISGVESRFWWKGRIDHAKETLILLKARAKKFKEIEKQIKNIHDYKVPEIVAIPITAGSKEYLDWIDSIA